MSTQLILYPQTYNGQFTSNATSVFNQYIVNGINFTGLDSTSLHNTTSVHPSQDAITNAYPYVLGNWYRYTTITGGSWGAVTAPALAAGSILLSVNASTEGRTGVYQQLSGLSVGGVYDVKILIATPQVGTLAIEIYTGPILNPPAQSFSTNTTLISTTFTAQSANDIFLIEYSGNVQILIQSIFIQESITTPSLIFSELEDGQVICDLYQEEDIPLSLSIDDFKNVAEKVQSYSKDFNLPATKRNNKIFNNMFEVTRADDGLIFNPYVKTKCVLKEDGFILFEGYLRLIDVKDKEGEISYNVNLYSEVIALADILKDQTFANLDFEELQHDYNKQEIKRSWNESPDASITYLNPSTSGFRETYDTLRYPFIDWSHQYLIGGAGGASSANSGNPELTALEQVFRPCIQLKYLINRIFAASGFNYTSNFFDSADFGKLYMDFNWGSNEFGTEATGGDYSGAIGSLPTIHSSSTFQSVALASNTFDSAMGWDNANNRFVAVHDNTTYDLNAVMYMGNTGGTTILTTRFARYNSGGSFIQEYDLQAANAANGIGAPPRISQTEAIIDSGDYLQFEWKTTLASDGYLSASAFVLIYGVTGSLIATTNTFLQTLRGETGQWDFLKGIMTMFNLVSMVDESNPDNILIEPYADVFINNTNCSTTTSALTLACRSIQHDWTEKIDASEMELKPLTDLNKNTIFQFVEDEDDYAFRVFKNSTSGHLYGSKEIDASTASNGMPTVLEGTKEIIAEPFAATVSKPLMPAFPSFIVPSIFSKNEDGTCEGFDNSPRIFYNNGVKSTGTTYFIPEQNGLSSENQSDFLQFSHLSDIPTIVSSPPALTDTRDFVFESQQLLSGLGDSPTDNLYSLYWQPYFSELYSPDTRTMTLKVNLSPSDVASFKFYDTVFIKNRVFRVNKIDYKPNDLATVEFILIP